MCTVEERECGTWRCCSVECILHRRCELLRTNKLANLRRLQAHSACGRAAGVPGHCRGQPLGTPCC